VQRRTAATTGTALATSDVTIDSVLIEKNRDSAAPTTYFDGDTLATGNDSKWDNPPARSPTRTSTDWVPGVSGVNGWQLQQFRTAAMEPQSHPGQRLHRLRLDHRAAAGGGAGAGRHDRGRATPTPTTPR
jgi:hypothetical protein